MEKTLVYIKRQKPDKPKKSGVSVSRFSSLMKGKGKLSFRHTLH